MIKFEVQRLNQLFSNFKQQRIAVIGDLMLDRYMWGKVDRISPEAPVPVVEVAAETIKLGGAANVANNILSLGAEPIPLGVVGDDDRGRRLRALFSEAGLQTQGIITDTTRPTTIKTRIIAHDQHVVRADVESKEDLGKTATQELLAAFQAILPEVQGIILQDYNKGVLTPNLIQEITQLCQERGCYIAVDPKFKNFFAYKTVSLFKPNTKETEQALGIKIESDDDLFSAARELFTRLDCQSILLTRGEKGMVLFPAITESPVIVPTRADKIHDVSGAGDTVISTLVVSKLAGASLLEAATMANFAAGLVCGEIGVVSVDRDKLYQELLNDSKSPK